MTTVVLLLSAGSTMISMSLFRSWRTNRSNDVWWRGFDYGKNIGYLSAIICFFLWESVDG